MQKWYICIFLYFLEVVTLIKPSQRNVSGSREKEKKMRMLTYFDAPKIWRNKILKKCNIIDKAYVVGNDKIRDMFKSVTDLIK